MRDDDRLSLERRGQRRAQPGLAIKRERADAFGEYRLAILDGRVLAQVVVRGAEGFGALLQLLGQRRALFHQCVEVAPQRGADETHAIDRDDFAIEPGDAQARAGFLQSRVGGVVVERVEFVVAGDEQHLRLRQGRHQER